MNQISSIVIQIIKIKLDVKFTCSMSLQIQGQVKAQSSQYVDGAFVFNSQILISTKQKKESPFWQAYAVLKTGRGANYNSGILRLRYSDLKSMSVNLMRQVPLSKCYDSSASVEIAVKRFQNNTLVNFSGDNYYTFRTQNDLGKHKNMVQIPKIQFEEKNIKVSQNGKEQKSIAEELDSKYLRQKIQQLSKIINQKCIRIRSLEAENAKKSETIDKNRLQNVKLVNEKQEKVQLLLSLQKQLAELQSELEGAHNYIEQKQEQFQSIQQQRWAQLDKIRQQYDSKYKKQLEQINQCASQAQILNTQLKNQILTKQQQIQQLYQKNESQNRKLKLAQAQRDQKETQTKGLRDKLKQYESTLVKIQQEKSLAINKMLLKQKQVDENKTMRKNYRKLEEQINILKKNAEKTLKLKQTALEKISYESKNKIDALTLQVKEKTALLKSSEARLKQVMQENEKIKQTAILNQTKLKQSIKLFQNQTSKQSTTKNILQQLTKNISSLQSQKKDHIQKIKHFQQQLQNLKKVNETLCSQLQKQNQKNATLTSQIQNMSYKIEKNTVQSAISLHKNERDHGQCRMKHEALKSQVQRYQVKSEEMFCQIVELKNKLKENQRIIHQLRLQETKNRDQGGGYMKKLFQNERLINKLQKQMKQKQIYINSLNQQKDKIQSLMGELENKNYNIKSEIMETNQKNMKLNASNEQMKRQFQQLMEQVKNKSITIQKLEHKELQLRKMMQQDKEKAIRAENETRMVKRQFQRYQIKIKAQVSQVIKLQQNSNPIQSLVSHYKSCMQRLQSSVTTLMKQLQSLKHDFQQKNTQIQTINIQYMTANNELNKRNQQIEKLQKQLQANQQSLGIIAQEHNQLLSIHQEYIFQYNRYKLDKEEELATLQEKIREFTIKELEMIQAKSQLDKGIQDKVKCINKLKDQKFQVQTKVKGLEKNIQKLSYELWDLSAKNQLDLAKTQKIGNQLNLEIDKNHKLLLEEQQQRSRLEGIENQLNQTRNILQMTIKNKQKLSKQTIQQAQRILILQFQNQSLKSNNESVQQEYKNTLNAVENHKQTIKTLKIRIKQLEQQLKGSGAQTKINLQQYSKEVQELQKWKNQQMQRHKELIKQRQQLMEQNKQKEQRANRLQQRLNHLQIQNQSLSSQIIIIESNLSMSRQENGKIEEIYQKKIQKLKQQIADRQRFQAQLKKSFQDKVLKIDKLEKNVRQLEKEVSEKQQQKYIITGKKTQLQIKWQSQEKRLKQLQEHLKLYYEQQVQQETLFYQNRQKQLVHQKQKFEQQWLSQQKQLYHKKLQIERLQATVKQINENMTNKITFYEQQIATITQSFQLKIEKIQASLINKQSEIDRLRLEKSKMEQM